MLANGPNIPPPVIWRPPASGVYTGGLFTGYATSAGITAADFLYAIPCALPLPALYGHVSVRVDTGIGGSNARLGVYADNSGTPGALIEDAGTFTPTAAGFYDVAFAAPRAIGPGMVWLALVTDTTTVQWERTHSIGGYAQWATQSGTNLLGIRMIVRGSFAYAALPDPFGGSPSFSTSTAFRIQLKAA